MHIKYKQRPKIVHVHTAHWQILVSVEQKCYHSPAAFRGDKNMDLHILIWSSMVQLVFIDKYEHIYYYIGCQVKLCHVILAARTTILVTNYNQFKLLQPISRLGIFRCCVHIFK